MQQQQPVVLINIFTPKPGKMGEFIALQTSAVNRFSGQARGWLGSRLHRSEDDKTAVMMTVFESIEAHRQWNQTDAFDAHRKRVLELVENVSPGYYRVVHEAGHI